MPKGGARRNAGRKKLPAPVARRYWALVGLRQEELAAVDLAAEAAGRSRSSWCREVLLAALDRGGA